MEYYFEQSVSNNYPNRHKKKLLLIKIMKWVFILFGIVFIFLAFNTPVEEGASVGQVVFWMVSLLVVALTFFGGSFFMSRYAFGANPEFDYFVNGNNFLIVKVLNKSKRKKFKTYKIDAFQEIGKAMSESFDRHAAQKVIKQVYAVANPEDTDNLFYALINADGDKALLIFEPSEELIITITRTLNRNIFADKKGYKY